MADLANEGRRELQALLLWAAAALRRRKPSLTRLDLALRSAFRGQSGSATSPRPSRS